MKKSLLILVFPFLISGCGKPSGDSQGSDSDLTEIPEQVIPDEVSYASTLLYPGADSLYFGGNIDFVGSIKSDYRENTDSIRVTKGEFSASVDVDENGLWRIDGIPLNKSLINTIRVSLLSDDTVLHSDDYRVLRSPGDISSNIVGKETEAYLFSYPANTIFRVDFTTGIVDPLMSVEAANRDRRLTKVGDRIYSADSHWGLWVHRISTGLTVAHFDLEQHGVDDISWNGPGGSLYSDRETGDIYYYTPSGYNGEAIDNHGDQIHVLYQVDPDSGALTEVSGGPRGSGDRFYYSSGGVLSSSDKAFYIIATTGTEAPYNLYKVDLASGDRTILVENIPQSRSIIGISADENTFYLKVEAYNDKIISYDKSTGEIVDKAILGIDSLQMYGFRSAISFEGTTNVYLHNTITDNIYRLDDSGNGELVVSSHLDKWSVISGYDHSYFDLITGEVYFSYMDAIGKYSIDSGRGKIVTSDNYDYHDSIVGEGGNIGWIQEMFIDSSTETAYVFDSRSDLYSVNLSTGNRTEIPLLKPSGFDDFYAGGMALSSSGGAIYSSNGRQLFKVNLDTDELTLLPESVDDGFDFTSVSDIQYDDEGGALWVSGQLPSGNEVVRVDLASGERHRLFDDLLKVSAPATPGATYLFVPDNTLYILFTNGDIYSYDVDGNQLKYITTLALGDISVGRTLGGYEIQYIPDSGVILATIDLGIFSVDLKTGRSAQFQ
jgi:hypothetical protein